MDLCRSYNRVIQSDDFRNFDRNLKIAKGKSTKVFYNDIVKRIKLEFLGKIDDNGLISTYSYDSTSKTFSTSQARFENLIVGNNILQDVVKLYAEMASDKKPVVECNDESFVETIDFADITGEAVFTNSYSGSMLIKGVVNQQLGTFSTYHIKRNEFYEVFDEFNPSLIKAYVVFEMVEDSIMKCEIYTDGRTEYKKFKVEKESWTAIPYDEDLGQYGLSVTEDGLGFYNEYEGWQVAEVSGYSVYNDDLISNVREIVIQDTTTSQAFNKCLNPIIQVPESVIEYDNYGNGKVKIDDRTVTVEKDDRDIKQIQIQTNTADWNLQRENLLQNIYTSTGTNENVLGVNKNGMSLGSGVSIERSMQRVLSVVNYRRNKVYKAIQNVLKWCYKELNGSNLEIKIIGEDILSKNSKELLVEKGLELDNLNKIATVYSTLINLNADVEIQNMAIQLGDDLKEKLKATFLGGKNETKSN
ncbi:MAG: hypothetical protein ACRCZ2_01200 [Fusobacteriaceae bacterium]